MNNQQLQMFNLTSLSRSEAVLSATLHYYVGEPQNRTQIPGCSQNGPRPRSCGAPPPARHKGRRHIQMVVWSFSSVGNRSRTLGRFVINVSDRDFISWQWKDITRVVNQAKRHDELLIGIDVTSQPGSRTWKQLFSNHSPYILVYANDSAISEAQSVVSTLQRHQRHTTTATTRGDGTLAPGIRQLRRHPGNNTVVTPHRVRRSANVLLPLQNNELPGPEYPYDTLGWDDTSPYQPQENKPPRRPRKKQRVKNQRQEGKMALLQFDEQTIKKARKKQWNVPRNCARRYLKVDFADIGWSEWIISPKSFDAFYCSGTCQFPMPKSVKPSNHATIQSIVRAVGLVPGVPEPCCVPEQMSSLSILFFDEDNNVVLKVYPNMTVESCACR
ncbi:hypothetical protein DPEC_G00118860 [Dallia pectoralis]|uniref:Uncharacterized protein n=1 Tax=Dallia pectoralis TaxID=75939 RepID=A0ACC2GQ31_DALPE|nr:hypothetical protein DPEC_G00118860 [Dallia pectoralis]